MEKRKKEEEEAVKETMKSLGDCIHAQVFETVPHTIGGEYSVVFSDALHLAFTHSALPLGLFSNVNLREIFMKNHNVPTCTFIPTSATTKLGVTSKKVTILDIAKICAELSVSEEELEGMDLEKFHECTFNFTQLCREVDNKNGGNPFFSEFTTNHFQFFLGKHDCSELFQYWKPQEKELHDQFFIDQHPYQVAYWEEVYRSCQLFKLSADNIKVEIDKLRQEKLIGENGAGGKKKSDIAGSRASQAYQPFPKSNKESKPTLAPCCILCGEHGHRCNECPNAKKAIWAIYCNGEVTHPDTNKPVCVLFNIFHKEQLSCIDKSGKSATGKCGKLHVCSFCSKSDHGALRDMLLIEHTVIMPNHPSATEHPEIINEYIQKELVAGCFCGLFTKEDMESIMCSPFITSPFIISEQDQGPGLPPKFRAC
uniref:CCHC-type domain-containing protein n=1 Tax=Moniliophthora roreri TaxID=221103 RepID=A0A0W0GBD0_MONRR